MVFEFGTMNSQKTFGSLKSLQYSMMENQGRQYGFYSIKDSLEVMQNYRNLFFADEVRWRSQCVAEFSRGMDTALKNFAKNDSAIQP
jgi:hypothetical protein